MTPAELVRTVMRHSIMLTELQHTRVQLRIATVLLLSTIMFSLIDPAIYILTVDSSLYYRIGRALHQPELLAACFLGSAGTLLPHVLVQVFWSTAPFKRMAARLMKVRGVRNTVYWLRSFDTVRALIGALAWCRKRLDRYGPLHRATAKIACLGLFAAGVQWIFLAWYIRAWDVPSVSMVFFRLGVGAIAFSLTLALALNAELARKFLEPVP